MICFKTNSVKKIYKVYPTRWSVTKHVTCFNCTPNKCSIQCRVPTRVGPTTQSNNAFLTHYLIEQVNNVFQIVVWYLLQYIYIFRFFFCTLVDNISFTLNRICSRRGFRGSHSDFESKFTNRQRCSFKIEFVHLTVKSHNESW